MANNLILAISFGFKLNSNLKEMIIHVFGLPYAFGGKLVSVSLTDPSSTILETFQKEREFWEKMAIFECIYQLELLMGQQATPSVIVILFLFTFYFCEFHFLSKTSNNSACQKKKSFDKA